MRLLLDAHMSPAAARVLRAIGIDVYALSEWQSGYYRHHLDEEILAAAVADARTLVTYDERSFSPILAAWALDGRSHAGVILVNVRTIRQQDRGSQIRALRALVEQSGDEPWVDRVLHLRSAYARSRV